MSSSFREYAIPVQSFRRELTRKIIHITIAFVPAMANWNFNMAVALLGSGIIYYVFNEKARISGHSFGMVSRLTEIASRPVERGFVWGPVTLGLGAMSALIFYPNPAATVAIYALAFGDGIASLAGKFLGRRSTVRIGEKTLEGSVSCFVAVFFSTLLYLDDYLPALAAAVTATILEMIPLQDADNLIIPLGTGFVMTLLT